MLKVNDNLIINFIEDGKMMYIFLKIIVLVVFCVIIFSVCILKLLFIINSILSCKDFFFIRFNNIKLIVIW